MKDYLVTLAVGMAIYAIFFAAIWAFVAFVSWNVNWFHDVFWKDTWPAFRFVLAIFVFVVPLHALKIHAESK